MKKLSLAIGTVALAVAATLAMADPGGYGMGMGMGPGCAAGAGPGAGAGAGCPGGYGPGAGAGPGFGRGGGYGMRGGGQGMALLTPEERTAHRDAMHSFKTVEECTAYMTQYQQLLQERAKAQGVTAPPGPRGNACERMKARGMIG
jgi:hypothetical protein